MGKLVPLVLILVGIGAGVGAGIALRPEPAAMEASCAEGEDCAEKPPPADQPAAVVETEGDDASPTEFVKMENQFVVPVLEDGAVQAMVVLSITLEMAPGRTDVAFDRRPRLRDGFLRVLLDHANRGGFSGAFTSNGAMERLRLALSETGAAVIGDALVDVLILDINRQDL